MDKKYSAPDYYVANRTLEPKDVIRSYKLNFNVGNAVKYIARCGAKAGEKEVDDISKAITYLGFEIEALRNGASADWGDPDIKDEPMVRKAIVDDWDLPAALSEALCGIFEAAMWSSPTVVIRELSDSRDALLGYLGHDDDDYKAGWNAAIAKVKAYVKSRGFSADGVAALNHLNSYCNDITK